MPSFALLCSALRRKTKIIITSQQQQQQQQQPIPLIKLLQLPHILNRWFCSFATLSFRLGFAQIAVRVSAFTYVHPPATTTTSSSHVLLEFACFRQYCPPSAPRRRLQWPGLEIFPRAPRSVAIFPRTKSPLCKPEGEQSRLRNQISRKLSRPGPADIPCPCQQHQRHPSRERRRGLFPPSPIMPNLIQRPMSTPRMNRPSSWSLA